MVEMLGVIAIFPIVALALDSMFRAVVIDIPRSSHVVEENTSVLDALDHIRSDIERAKSLPDTSGDYTAGDNVLLIELPDATICYELTDEGIVRRRLGENGTSSLWTAPNANIEWNVRRKDGVGYAVEMRTCIEHTRAERQTRKMAGTHLYFVGGL